MKRLFICLFGLIFLNLSVYAQSAKQTPSQLAGRQVQGMETLLKLDSSQFKGIRLILNEHFRKIDSIKNSTISEEEKSNQIKLIQMKKMENISKMLIPIQWQQYQAIVLEMERKSLKKTNQ